MFRGVPRVFGGVPGFSGVFRGCSGVFQGVPGVFRILQTPVSGPKGGIRVLKYLQKDCIFSCC